MIKGYLIIATRLRIFLTLLWHNGISIGPRHILCLLFLLQSSFWGSFLALREKVLFRRKLQNTPLPTNPLFIIGHWRTGTTFLHQLLCCDPQMTTPSLLQCTYPESFLSSHKYIEPIMSLFFLSNKRPMDNVRMGVNEPQEDEYALFRMTGFSPIERLVFPRSKKYFLEEADHFLPPPHRYQEWENALKLFTKKLFFAAGKRIVYKNPFHSLRIATLLKIFPDAQFIHIYRNPCDVIPSTLHMWSIVGKENALKRKWRTPKIEEVITGYDNFMHKLRENTALLPKEKYVEVQYEELEKDPVKTIKKIYKHLKIDMSPTVEKKMKIFLYDIKGFKKNRYHLSKGQEELIKTRLEGQLKRYGY